MVSRERGLCTGKFLVFRIIPRMERIERLQAQARNEKEKLPALSCFPGDIPGAGKESLSGEGSHSIMRRSYEGIELCHGFQK